MNHDEMVDLEAASVVVRREGVRISFHDDGDISVTIPADYARVAAGVERLVADLVKQQQRALDAEMKLDAVRERLLVAVHGLDAPHASIDHLLTQVEARLASPLGVTYLLLHVREMRWRLWRLLHPNEGLTSEAALPDLPDLVTQAEKYIRELRERLRLVRS